MCNLYSVTKGQKAIMEAVEAMIDNTGNLAPMPGVYPNVFAPIIRNTKDGRQLTMARWGMPTPSFYLKGKNYDSGVTNIREVSSKHWQRWLGLEHRCVVPFTSFAENEKQPDGKSPPCWFALDEQRPLAFFAGVWTHWTSVRKVSEGETTQDIYAFLTTDPNTEVKAVHPKAMPVILRTREEVERWLTAPTAEALELQKPLPNGSLKIVGRGMKSDTAGFIA